MELGGGEWEKMLIERLPVLPGLPSRSCRDEANTVGEPSQTSNTGLFHLSEEVLVFILRFLDPFSLLRAGSTCKRLFRICSCSSIWTRHCQALFGVSFRTSPVSPKDAFRLLFMWRKLYQMLPCNRHFQKKLLAEFPPPRYWIQWLVLEERVPLPPVKLPDFEIEYIWGVKKECFDETHKEDSETCTGYIFKYDWKELYHLTLLHHGSFGNLLLHVLNRQNGNGIQTLENYFSMCKSLVAWILGRDWGRLKRRKVYHDTLEGVYRVLKTEMRTSLIDHDHFWQVAKVQMARVCKLEETAVNYVNWKMIDSGPYYRLYLVSGNSIYLEHIKGFLRRKRLISDWFLQDENLWVRHLLSEELCQLLEFDTKILEGSLHGDTLSAHLSRIIWLYLHSGQELYMDAVKGFVLECAGARLKFYSSVNTGFYSSSSSDRECLNTHVELCANEHFLTYG
uniref:Si:dkeyp-114g9.1 n=1 Tax=Erpetoichthys calabaricus TaxID=27687 RepID=A0A8C4RKN0_ERPCA